MTTPRKDPAPPPMDLDTLSEANIGHYSTDDLQAIIDLCQGELMRRLPVVHMEPLKKETRKRQK